MTSSGGSSRMKETDYSRKRNNEIQRGMKRTTDTAVPSAVTWHKRWISGCTNHERGHDTV